MRAIEGAYPKAAAAVLAAVMLALTWGCDGGGKETRAAMEPAADKPAVQEQAAMTAPEVKGAYAPINGLSMYYEIHGTGKPLILVHGAFMAIPAWGDILTELAKVRQVIAVELQGHGRTADIDRPFSFEAFADDMAALLRHLSLAKADIAGYSLGGGVALLTAVRYPEMIDKLIVISAPAKSEGWHKEVLETVAQIKPEVFDGTPIRLGYDKLAPDPAAFPALVEKIKAAQAKPYDWSRDIARALRSPTLIVLGDSDGVRPEHAVEMFRLCGGGVFGDVAGLPKSQLAVLPGTHHVGVIFRGPWLAPMILDFLEGNAIEFPR
jgi:pimeloyl-ACP methyl ester carboxylesterase